MAYPSNTSPPIDPVKLDKLAQVAINVGLQLQKGQDLVLTAPVSALPLVRRIAEHAYKAGATLVTPIFSDEQLTLARYHNAPDESFDRAPGVALRGHGDRLRQQRGAARDRRRQSDAARQRGPGQGRARQPRQLDGL